MEVPGWGLMHPAPSWSWVESPHFNIVLWCVGYSCGFLAEIEAHKWDKNKKRKLKRYSPIFHGFCIQSLSFLGSKTSSFNWAIKKYLFDALIYIYIYYSYLYYPIHRGLWSPIVVKPMDQLTMRWDLQFLHQAVLPALPNPWWSLGWSLTWSPPCSRICRCGSVFGCDLGKFQETDGDLQVNLRFVFP